MIQLVGTEGCGRCQMVKNILATKNIKFDFVLLDDYKDKDDLLYRAKKKGHMTLPLLLRDGELINITEV